MRTQSASALLLCYLMLSGCSNNLATNQNLETSSPFLAASPAMTEDLTWYQPSVSATWQWQLTGDLNTSYEVDIYDFDLFDTPTSTITALREDGIKVICYFSAGSYEDWREDAGQFMDSEIGKPLDEWSSESWLDITSNNVQQIMETRLDLAVEKGCDGVEPDNVDGYIQDTGFAITYSEQLDFNMFLADSAHERNLAIGLKNNLQQVEELLTYYDFVINEACNFNDECEALEPVIEQGKAVLHVEYDDKYVEDETARNTLCDEMKQRQFSTLVLPGDLGDAYRYSCL